MARKQILPAYYAYFDKATGEILSVSNEKSLQYKNKLDIEYDIYAKLVSGNEKFSDYSVGYLKSDDGKTTLVLVPKTDQAFIFKNTMFELISRVPTDDTELIVTWNVANTEWIFSVSPACKKRIAESIGNGKLVFFVILADDYDFLIRTIFIDTMQLLSSGKVYIPFANKIESNINKISMATKLTFESYGLTVND